MTQDFKKMFGGINNPPSKPEPDKAPHDVGRDIPPAVKESKKRVTRRKRKTPHKPRFFDLLEAQMKVLGIEEKVDTMTLKDAYACLESGGIVLSSSIPQISND